MSTSSQEFLNAFDRLPELEKREVASEIIRHTFALDSKIECEDAQLTSLYAEFAEADRALAEEGMEGYERGLLVEDL